jgi:hypothetical protein
MASLAYSFALGLLHGILHDEHTWPITFSCSIGGAGGKEVRDVCSKEANQSNNIRHFID